MKSSDEKGNAVVSFDAAAEFAKLSTGKSGGVYMPPARLRALQASLSEDKSSAEYQRLAWDALRKSITGLINRVNITNIKQVVQELFAENLIRGKGLFCRSVMKAQAASLGFTNVFSALVAVVNSQLPAVGELLVVRLVSQFRRAYKRNDKIVCQSTTTFIAHLINQLVAHELLALEILMLLLDKPTDDSIEIAVSFTREVGAYLTENAPKATTFIFERFRAVLNEGAIGVRVQYMIEVLMQVRKDKFKDNKVLEEGLDLVESEDQITHEVKLDGELKVQEGLNIFKADPNYLENEEKYKAMKAEILGDSDADESGSEESSDDDEDEVVEDKAGIEDRTETNLVNLRRTIYLTIMNALNYEEAVHKLLKIQLGEGQELELINMIIECCSQERSYSTFYGLIAGRLSLLSPLYTEALTSAFGTYYTTIHRYETNRLRNIAKLFGGVIAADAVSWTVLSVIKMSEEDTTSGGRIFVKIVMGEVVETVGMKVVKERFNDPEIKRACAGMFPMGERGVPKDTRFAINYWTSIGMGAVTEDMREWLKNAPKLIMEQRRAALEADSSSSDSDSSSSSDSSSDSDSSDSDSESSRSRSHSVDRGGRAPISPSTRRRHVRSRSRSPARRDSRSPNARRVPRSPVRSPVRRASRLSPSRSRSRSRSRSPPRRPAGRDRDRDRDAPHRDRSRSRSPPRRPAGRDRDMDRDAPHRDRSRSRSPIPRRRSPPRRPRERSLPRRDRDRSPPKRERDRSPRRARDRSPPPKRDRSGSPPARDRSPPPPPPPPRRDRSRSPPRREMRDRDGDVKMRDAGTKEKELRDVLVQRDSGRERDRGYAGRQRDNGYAGRN